MVGGVLPFGRFAHLHRRGYTLKRFRNLASVCPSGFVAVRDDRHLRATEAVRVLVAPLPRTPGVAGRHHARLLQRVNVLLALNDPDRAPVLDRLKHLRQPVEDTAGVAELPFPTPGTIRLALAEVLRREPDDLEERLAALVRVVVLGDDLAVSVAVAVRLAQIRPGKPRCLSHRVRLTAGVAVEEPATFRRVT